MDLLRKYLSSGSDGNEHNGADIVETLVDRFQSATRTEDKRDALRTLKALSKKFRLEVGTRAMPVLIDALRNEREDADSVCYSLEALYSVMNDNETDSIDTHELLNVPADLGSQFTEMFINKGDNMALVLECVDTYEPHVRRNALRLITLCLANQSKSTQEVILQCPRAISRLVDILSDPREALRNDALLLLLEFTRSHTNIQKIVAFENSFEHLFSIVHSEGLTDGGVVVEDCLRLLLQLLSGNPANQVLFKEHNFIPRLVPLLQLPFESHSEGVPPEPQWSVQKVVNLDLTLQIVRALVSPMNKAQDVRLCQVTMYHCGLLSAVCGMVMATGVPADVLTRAIYAVADIIRDCPANQEFLAQLIAPSEPPQPAINILLVSMVNERQTLDVRVAALYCFQCYVASNTQTQTAIINSLLQLPSSESIGIGRLLCGGLFSNDVLSVWLSSVALLHCIRDNPQLKEDLLRVHLALTANGSSVSLLQHAFSLFHTSKKFQTKIGLLQLFCAWLSHCPAAVRTFLTSVPDATTQPKKDGRQSANLSILLAMASTSDNEETETLIRGLVTLLTCICVLFNPGDVPGSDRATLLNTLEKRMGLDTVLEVLNQVSKSEAFVLASKHPELAFDSGLDLVFDYAFTQLFKRLEYEILYTFKPPLAVSSQPTNATDHVVRELNQKLCEKDRELEALRSRISSLELASRASCVESEHQVTTTHGTSDVERTLKQVPSPPTSDELTRSLQRIHYLEQALSQTTRERDEIKAEQDDLLVLLHDQGVKLKRLKSQVQQLGGQVDIDSDDEQDPVPGVSSPPVVSASCPVAVSTTPAIATYFTPQDNHFTAPTANPYVQPVANPYLQHTTPFYPTADNPPGSNGHAPAASKNYFV